MDFAEVPSLEDYAGMVKGKKCIICNSKLPAKISLYPHAGGWDVKDYERRQWLYVVCQKCHYQNALWKIGIDCVFLL